MSFQHIAFDGPISLPVACLLGLAIIAIAGAMLYKERSVLGMRTAALFWLLRTTAVAVLVWLLLSPSRVTVERTTTPKAIAVLTDTSGSMKTVDRVRFQQRRWQLGPAHGVAEESSPHPLALTDRAVVAAKIAQAQLQAATQSVQQQQPEDVALRALSLADHSIRRVQQHLSDLEELVRPDSADRGGDGRADLRQLVGEIQQMLTDDMFAVLADVSSRHQRGQPIDSRKWQDPLPDVTHRMEVVHRELSRLTTIAENLPVRDVSSGPAVSAAPGAGGPPTGEGSLTSTTRLGQVEEFLDQWTATLGPKIQRNIRRYQFDKELVEVRDGSSHFTSGDALQTDVGQAIGALGDLHQTSPLAAVVMLSDMSDNGRGNREAAALAKDLGLPFYLLPTGNTGFVRDVEMASVTAPSVVLQGDRIVVEATIRAHQCEGETLRLELLENTDVAGTRELPIASTMETRRVRIEADASEIGIHGYVLRVVPVDDELTDENNLQEFQVHVTQDSIRVLVTDEMARYEHRYLTHLLRRDEQVEHDELVSQPRLVATGERQATGQLPQTVDQWNDYDVVLLGDVPTDTLTVTSQLALLEYLEKRGGTVVIVAGANHMPGAYGNQPIESILPVQQVTDASSESALTPGTTYHAAMTEDGWRHHALWIGDDRASTAEAWEFVNDNSPIEWVSPFRQPRPAAHSLISLTPATAKSPSTESFLSWQSVGRGRVVFLSSPESYRLRFLRGDRLHHRFWGQLFRWAAATDLAAGSDLVRIRTERSYYYNEEPIQVTVQLHDQEGDPMSEGHVQVTATDVTDAQRQTTITLEPTTTPGYFTGQLRQLPDGQYRIEPTGAAVDALLATDDSNDQVAAQSPPTTDQAARPATSVQVRSRMQRELIDTRCDLAFAQKLAQATGGQILPPTAISEVVALTDLTPLISETTTEELLWPRWYWLAAIFACLNIEWITRKLRGLS